MKKRLVLLYLVMICLCLSSAAIPLSAADQPKDKPTIFGNWKISIDFDGRTMTNRMSVTPKPSGPPDVQWSGGFGNPKISDVNLVNNKLTFVRTTTGRDGEEMETEIEATLQPDGSLKGSMSSDFGEFDFTGTRVIPMSDAAGKWEIKLQKGDTTTTDQLNISPNPAGNLQGTWISQGSPSPVLNIKFEKGKLTFTCKINQAESTFAGEVKADELKGALTSDRGKSDVTGKRIGKEIIGEWDITSTSERGEMTNRLTVEKDLTTVYGMGFGEVDVNDLKLEGDKVTFSVKFGFGDREFKLSFSGKLSGDKLDGEFTSDRGTNKAEGKRVVPKPAEPAAQPPKPAEVKPQEKK